MILKQSRKALSQYGFLAFALCIYIFAFGRTVWTGFTQPANNWDMLAYIGVVISYDTPDPRAIYQGTIREISGHPGVNRTMPVSADEFYQPMPFYRVKPLYTGTLWLLNRLGMDLTRATWYVSAASFALLGFVLAWWRPSTANRRGVWLLLVALMCLYGRMETLGGLARLSTPDAFGLLWFMSGVMAWWRRKSYAVFFVCALLSVLARPDMLVLVLMLSLYFAFFAVKERRMAFRKALAAACAAIAACCCVQYAAGGFGWETMFYYNFTYRDPDIAHAAVTVTWSQYWNALVSVLAGGKLWLTYVPFFLLASGQALFCAGPKPDRKQWPWIWLLVGAWGAFAGRFLLFPSDEDRFYFPCYLLMLMALIEIPSPWGKDRRAESLS